MHFVDMPGAERLVMEPEVLRLREGSQINRSLLGFVGVLKRWAAWAGMACSLDGCGEHGGGLPRQHSVARSRAGVCVRACTLPSDHPRTSCTTSHVNM